MRRFYLLAVAVAALAVLCLPAHADGPSRPELAQFDAGTLDVAHVEAPAPEPTPVIDAREVSRALNRGDYGAAVVLLLGLLATLLVPLGKRLPGRAGEWLASRWGKFTLTVVGVAAGTVSAGLAGGEPLSVSLVLSGLMTGLTVKGGYDAIREGSEDVKARKAKKKPAAAGEG